MNTIRIIRKGEDTALPTFLIDRTTPLGNQNRIGRDGTREEVIEKYKEYFNKEMMNNPKFRFLVEIIYRQFKDSSIALACHCSPLACHGTVIKEYLEQRYQREHL